MNTLRLKLNLSLLAVSLFAAAPVLAQVQPDKSVPKRPPVARPEVPEPPETPGRDSAEKTIAVDKNVSVSLCVTQGTLKINGWNRGEVRVFVKDGAKFGFQVLEKSMHGDQPGWIKILQAQPAMPRRTNQSECIWGDVIEIDVPANTTLNLTGRETTTTVDGLRKAEVKTIGGDISLRNIAEGITASTYQGDITVDESQGQIMLDTTSGNILVFDVGPSQIGDVFKAKTNGGTISLDTIKHRQIDVNSITGSVFYSGEIRAGGTYGLTTIRGSIKMSIPETSSCQVIASYGAGSFVSDLPIKLETENITPGPIKQRIGLIGKGGAWLRLTSNNGSIVIKKQ